jgi:type IV fimbrial biogenesis protein FimT
MRPNVLTLSTLPPQLFTYRQVLRSRQSGLTMVELMVVISIAAILLGLGAPSLSALVNKTRLNSAASLLANDLNLARSEAVKRNARMLVCPPNGTGTDCQTVSPSWTAGWLVCIDANSDGACDTSTAAAPNPLMLRPALESNLTLTALDTASTPAAVTQVRFNPNGRQGAGTLFVNITMGGTWSGALPKTVSISNTGNVSIH